MKKPVLILICILLSVGTLSAWEQDVDITIAAGAYYKLYPADSDFYSALGNESLLTNLRVGLTAGLLFKFTDMMSFGTEFHTGYFLYSDDSSGSVLHMFDFSGRGIFDFQINKISVKPYFGYAPSLYFAGPFLTLIHSLEAGLRVSIIGIFIEGSFLISMDGGDHFFKAGLGYELRI